MQKTNSKKLSKRLAQYGAMSAAIAGVTDAQGQIMYTDESPDFAGGIGSEYFLDIDNNNIDDFKIYNQNSNLYIAPLTANNNVLGSAGGTTFAYPFALSSGDAISSGAADWNNNGFSGGYQSLAYNSSSSSSSSCIGNWCGGQTDKYIGLQFIINGATHYGWVRLDNSADANTWSVKDYAYNSDANQAINSGQEAVLGVSDNNEYGTDIRIVALNKSIGLYNLGESTDYKLLSMNGITVLNGTIADHTYVIEANSLATGIYIIELSDNNSNGVIRKKIIL